MMKRLVRGRATAAAPHEGGGSFPLEHGSDAEVEKVRKVIRRRYLAARQSSNPARRASSAG